MAMSPAAMLDPILRPQIAGVRDSIPHRFIAAWLDYPARTAIIDGGRGDAKFDYQTLAMGSHLFATWLATQTDTRAQNYGILLPAGLGFATSFMAISILGKTVVPLNYALSPKELAAIVQDAGITTLVSFEPDAADKASQAIFGDSLSYLAAHVPTLGQVVPINHHHIQGTIRAQTPFVQLPAIAPDDIAVLLYTSGSTGRPKGVMQTHRNLVSNADAAADALGAGPDNTILGVLPPFHSFALVACLLYPLFNGAACWWEPRFSPRTILERLGPNGVTAVLGVPSMYKAYVLAARGRPSEAFANVRALISGGAPLPTEIVEQFRRVFGKEIHEGYGCTETSPIISLNPLDEAPHYGTVGRPLTDITVEIRDAAGKVLAPGEPGEIWAHGPNVTLGYYGQPEETAKVFQNGWYNTQDMGTLTEDGFVKILGRTKHMIIVGGENVYPAEVEHAVLMVPEVKDVAVTGIPDPNKGEAVHAYVVAVDGFTGTIEDMESAIRRFLSEKDLLANYKMPHKVTLIPMIPLLPTGKPDLLALKGEREAILNVGVAMAQAAAVKAEIEAMKAEAAQAGG